MALTCVNTDAALGAADEQAGAVVMEMRRGQLPVRLCVVLGNGGEARLGDQRLGAHAAARRHDRAVHAARTLRLGGQEERRRGMRGHLSFILSTCYIFILHIHLFSFVITYSWAVLVCLRFCMLFFPVATY